MNVLVSFPSGCKAISVDFYFVVVGVGGDKSVHIVLCFCSLETLAYFPNRRPSFERRGSLKKRNVKLFLLLLTVKILLVPRDYLLIE